MDSAELEIGLFRKDASSYSIELRFTEPSGGGDTWIASYDGQTMTLDAAELLDKIHDPDAYGEVLTRQLFASELVKDEFIKARAVARSHDMSIRMRLHIAPEAPELQAFRWETLRDPESGRPLFTDESTSFSRYLTDSNWPPISVTASKSMRALAVIANPTNLSEYAVNGQPLAPITEAVIDGLNASIVGVQHVDLGRDDRALAAPTLGNIMHQLRDGVEVFILLAHGYIADGEAQVLLENDDGTAHRISGEEFGRRIYELERQPRLVVLISCESAGGDDPENEQAALGRLLAGAGIPAVLAMRGAVSISSMEEFLPVFIRELRRDGEIDRAVAAARSTIAGKPDWWAPALFTRLKTGRVWFRPGFGAGGSGADMWPKLTSAIKRGKCTPVLGPGLLDGVLGPRRDLARRWAEKYHFPLAPHLQDDLPQVAQFVVSRVGVQMRDELAEYLVHEVQKRYGSQLPPELADRDPAMEGTLTKLIAPLGNILRDRNPSEPHRVLASLPFPLYITTENLGFLADAITAESKDAVVELSRWRSDEDMALWTPSVFAPEGSAGPGGEDASDREDDYYPSKERPLLYHLFGHVNQPDSVVLTEDDYLDFLIGVTRNADLVPKSVRRALTDSSLLFLGFRMDEWEFRVLFRSLMDRQGSSRRTGHTHVAVQLDPDEDNTLDPARARRYLEDYFKVEDVDIYWGSTDLFLAELDEQWAQEGQ